MLNIIDLIKIRSFINRTWFMKPAITAMVMYSCDQFPAGTDPVFGMANVRDAWWDTVSKMETRHTSHWLNCVSFFTIVHENNARLFLSDVGWLPFYGRSHRQERQERLQVQGRLQTGRKIHGCCGLPSVESHDFYKLYNLHKIALPQNEINVLKEQCKILWVYFVANFCVRNLGCWALGNLIVILNTQYLISN